MGDASGNVRNELAESRSPYLLQHAANPVHWREWGEKAFGEARARDVPIFLSIGYSTCHWCHVMAHESFESDEVARLLNEGFVNVKLDREERPDVDRVYMSYVQATTGSGGWPMSVWLTPDLKPFYGGTYFPPEDRHGRVGFKTLVMKITELWRTERSRLVAYGEESVKLMRGEAQQSVDDASSDARHAISSCLSELTSTFDSSYGGFGSSPKFPMPSNLIFLIECSAREVSPTGAVGPKDVLERTLEKMAQGGVWDHLGGGFHRYSVDRYWHVPHYEKMLYDQGQLSQVYAEAYRVSGNELFRDVALATVAYLARDMAGPEGQLYAAEDADSPSPEDPSQSKEGAFYVWTDAEVRQELGGEAEPFAAAFDVKEAGNARPESDPHGELSGTNTLARVASDAELAERFGGSEEEIRSRLEGAMRHLFEKRDKRPRPHLDDKAIASWNGLAISGACKVYQACGDEKALALAEKAGAFLWDFMWQSEERAFRRVYRNGLGAAAGFAEDYAAASNAFVDLYECSFDPLWLERSREVVEQLLTRFEDEERGGFYASEAEDSSVIVRMRDDYDGAEPAASSLAALALFRLGTLLGSEELLLKASRAVEGFAAQWTRAPRAMPLMLVAAWRLIEPVQQVVIVGNKDSEALLRMARVANHWRQPHSSVIVLNWGEPLPKAFAGNERLKAMLKPGESRDALAYVCEDYACHAPVFTAEDLEAALRA